MCLTHLALLSIVFMCLVNLRFLSMCTLRCLIDVDHFISKFLFLFLIEYFIYE